MQLFFFFFTEKYTVQFVSYWLDSWFVTRLRQPSWMFMKMPQQPTMKQWLYRGAWFCTVFVSTLPHIRLTVVIGPTRSRTGGNSSEWERGRMHLQIQHELANLAHSQASKSLSYPLKLFGQPPTITSTHTSDEQYGSYCACQNNGVNDGVISDTSFAFFSKCLFHSKHFYSS